MGVPLINLAIADDHTLFRKVLSEYLSSQKNIRVNIHAADASDLLNKLKSSATDIIILDLFTPGMNVFDVIKIITEEFPFLKIIMLSMCQDLNVISSLLDLGINAYISKNDDPVDLIQAISAVADNRIYRNYLFTEALFSSKENYMNRKANNAPELDEREKKVIQRLWEEMTNREIAKEFYLSIRSVEKIRQDLKGKLGFKSIAGLFKYGLDRGIISAGESSGKYLNCDQSNAAKKVFQRRHTQE
jgi:DNA-binding NarL/FixJ family response regulator